MSYCQGKTKAKVKITWTSGVSETVESENVGVEVTKVAAYQYKVNYHHDVAPNDSNFVDSYDSSKEVGVLEEPISYSLSSSSDKKIVDLIITSGTPPKTQTVVMARNFSYGSIFSNLQFVRSEVYSKVVVTDSKGNKIERMNKGDADWVVTCDDDCKPGEIKCEHPGYPGFCCIPCQGTASKINNLAAKVGR